ncbi:nucleoside monophosphate kinase [Candidatus Curtissbacteria bacterium]|nr:nucleoside monophosphate kinase [Candidatus Curtissbacteria bacterium]
MKLIFLGSQGSGKSTQAKMLAQKLGIPAIEMGQLLREKAKKNDIEAGEIRQAIQTGNLVPDVITVRTLQERISRPDCQSGYVLDGYPRNYAQLEGLDDDIDVVFDIKVSDQEGIKRLIDRSRHDDSLEVITRRLAIFHKETEPLLAYFRNKGILEEVDGARSIEEIHQDVVKRIEKYKTKDHANSKI